MTDNNNNYPDPFAEKGIDETIHNGYYNSKVNAINQKINNDNEEGEDALDLTAEAEAFASYLASTDLSPSYVLGIMGKWGTGKSYFFNLLKKKLVQIQKEQPDIKTVGHMYLIQFDAWTYSKDSVWASLMYRIYKDLGEQLQLESILREQHSDDNLSVIEIYEALTKNELEYVKEKGSLKKENIQSLKNKLNENVSVSTAFAKFFEEDKKDFETTEAKLRKAEENLMNEQTRAIWNERKDKNPLIKLVWKKVMAMATEQQEVAMTMKQQNILNQSLEQNYSDFLNVWEKLKFFRASWSTIDSFILGIALVVIGILMYLVFTLSEEEVLEKLMAAGGSIVALFTGAIAWYNRLQSRIIQESKHFSDVTAKINEAISTDKGNIEAPVTNDVIEVKKKEVEKMSADLKRKRERMLILDGQSVHSYVNERMKSMVYLDHLGMLHQVKEDLTYLTQAIYSKYQREKDSTGVGQNGDQNKAPPKVFPRGEPRIVLFVDDLDRCDPNKVNEVLEAIQLLVRTKLFVIVLSIDPDYVCLSLEHKYKGILSKSVYPTGMDFVEKIIEQPFRLPGVTKENMKKLIEAQNIESEENEDESDQERSSNTISSNSQASADRSLLVQTFSERDKKLLLKACTAFPIGPRAAKRIINTFKIMKYVWLRRKRITSDTHAYACLLLLVMCSCERTSAKIQDIFSKLDNGKLILGQKEDPNTNHNCLKNLIDELKILVSDDCLAELGGKMSAEDAEKCLRDAASYSFFRRNTDMSEKTVSTN